MDLELAKAAWQRERLEFLREKPLKERAADIKRKAMKMEQKFKREQKERLSWGIVALILLASLYDPHSSLLSKVGLGLMVLCGSAALASHYVLRRRFRESRPELPRREYLVEQRKNMREQIFVWRLHGVLLVPPMFLGLCLWLPAWLHSKAHTLLMTPFIAIAFVFGLLAILWRIRKELVPAINEIDQELNQSD